MPTPNPEKLKNLKTVFELIPTLEIKIVKMNLLVVELLEGI
jgi:hypothetical protein